MKIDVKKVSKLSNLTLTDKEEKEFDEQLNDILHYIEQLNKIDTTAVEPTTQVTGLKNITRSDEHIGGMLPPEESTSGTEKKHNNMFVVDKLVETNE